MPPLKTKQIKPNESVWTIESFYIPLYISPSKETIHSRNMDWNRKARKQVEEGTC